MQDQSSTEVNDTVEARYIARMAAAGVPEHLRGGLVRYLVNGLRPGHFLTAVLENDLREAMGRADLNSRNGLYAIVVFLHNYAPATAWGSPHRVDAWLSSFQMGRAQC